MTRSGHCSIRGRKLGVVGYGELAAAVSELDLDEADVEELHGVERSDIELVEELDPALAVAERERAPDTRGRRKPRPAFPPPMAAVLLASGCEHRCGADAGP